MRGVAVAMSGGVDSSLAAALLVEAGRDVVGVTLRLGVPSSTAAQIGDDGAVSVAQAVCAKLGVPHVVVDAASEFAARVIEPYCRAYASGLTPNPCVWCNEQVKFGVLVEHAKRLGADTVATGHYTRLARDVDGEWVERGRDRRKDQSYFLYRVVPETLAMLEFPLGDLTKDEVRRMAAARRLPSALRRESQEVCFTDDHVALVASRYPDSLLPGPIEDTDGAVIGTHQGIARYTVGQRRGLGLGGPAGPYRVLSIDASRNAIVAGPRGTGALSRVLLTSPVWRLGSYARVLAQTRYRSQPTPATATLAADGLEVSFDHPVEVLAPGQSVVLYQNERVVGGGYVPTA